MNFFLRAYTDLPIKCLHFTAGPTKGSFISWLPNLPTEDNYIMEYQLLCFVPTKPLVNTVVTITSSTLQRDQLTSLRFYAETGTFTLDPYTNDVLLSCPVTITTTPRILAQPTAFVSFDLQFQDGSTPIDFWILELQLTFVPA